MVPMFTKHMAQRGIGFRQLGHAYNKKISLAIQLPSLYNKLNADK